MSVTIEDISKHLNLSVSTVSKALNGYTDVAPKTRERVTQVARDLGYHPSASARNLRRQRTDKIGFVFNNSVMFISDYFAEIIVGATATAEAHGHNIVLYTHEGDSPDSLLKLIRAREVDGFVLVWNHVPAVLVDLLLAEKVPFVVLGRRVAHERASFIAPDNYQGALDLMQHLYDLGHRRIAFTTRSAMGRTNEDRFQAYKDFLATKGLPYDPDLVVDTAVESNSGYAEALQLLELDNPPSAIFAFHDFVALNVQKALLDRGLRIPQDIALAGFDGLRASLLTVPPITTVRQPLVEIGRQSVAALLQRIAAPDQPPIQRTLPVTLSSRQSTTG